MNKIVVKEGINKDKAIEELVVALDLAMAYITTHEFDRETIIDMIADALNLVEEVSIKKEIHADD